MYKTVMTVRNDLDNDNNGCYLWPGVFQSDQWPVPPRRTGRAWHRDIHRGGRLTYPPCSLSSFLETAIQTCKTVNFYRFILLVKQISVLINSNWVPFKNYRYTKYCIQGNFPTTVLFLIQFPSLSRGEFKLGPFRTVNYVFCETKWYLEN